MYKPDEEEVVQAAENPPEIDNNDAEIPVETPPEEAEEEAVAEDKE
jgi:hypothetical protein